MQDIYLVDTYFICIVASRLTFYIGITLTVENTKKSHYATQQPQTKEQSSVLQQKILVGNNESLTLVCYHGGFIATGNFKRTKSILLQRCGSNRFFAVCPARVYLCFSAAKSEIDGYLLYIKTKLVLHTLLRVMHTF